MKSQIDPMGHDNVPPTTSHRGRLLTVNQFVKEHPWPPVGGLRWLIFHEKTNGFHKVVVRIGRRVLLDEDAFYAWAKSSGQRG